MNRIILATSAVMCNFVAIAQSKTVNGVTWHYNKVDATHVSIIGAAGYSDTLSIPSSIKVANANLTIVEIGANAFSATDDAYAMALQSVTIPSSVSRIGASAFSGCNSLTNVAIHDSVDSIGAGAFSGCVNLSRMTIFGRRSLLVHPDEFSESWISRAAALGVDGLYVHPVGGKKAVESLDSLLLLLENSEFRARIDLAREKGLEVAYEMHAGSWLLPRALYDEHPEYFRMDASGRRCRETNFCFSNPAAMDIAAHRAVLLARRLYGSSHRYFFWLDDTKNGGCRCEACRVYSASDQQLLFANRIVAELRKAIPDAQLGYLAYYDTVEQPTKVKPTEGIFLEFAPYERSFVTPIADQKINWKC